MAAIMNGLALHKGIRPYGGTFLVFTDYCRPSIRLACNNEVTNYLCYDPRFNWTGRRWPYTSTY